MGFHFTVGVYPDGRIGEVFVKADKPGSFVRGLMDMTAVSMSIGLQHGIPLDTYLSKMRNTQFQPEGYTQDQQFPKCTSPLDLLAQWLESKFILICPDCRERTQHKLNEQITCTCKGTNDLPSSNR